MVLRIRKLVIPLFCLSPLFFVDVYCLCENGKGKEGETECLNSVYFGETIYEPAVCLKRSTIKALTRSLVCRDPNADYCWYQCSATPTEGGQGKEVCSCDPEKEITPRDSKVPVKCYIPSGADCSWYRECLEKRIPCEDSQHYKYALTYAEKYCKLYEDRYSGFSQNGKKWINAVRKCLQESLVHVLYPQTNVTCENLKKTAFQSHIGCYKKPELNVKFCDLSLHDKARVFWTIKGALLTELLKTASAGWSVFKSCFFTESYPERTERIIQLEIEATSTKLTEKDVENIGHVLSEAVGWPRDIVYYASSSTASDNLNIIWIKIVIFSQSNNHVYLTEAERIVIEGTMNDKLVLLTLADGKTIRVLGAKGCNDPDCLSTWFAVRTCK